MQVYIFEARKIYVTHIFVVSFDFKKLSGNIQYLTSSAEINQFNKFMDISCQTPILNTQICVQDNININLRTYIYSKLTNTKQCLGNHSK